MAYDFDKIVDRRNTHSYKWDQNRQLFGDDDVLSLWVADMDFESPPAIREALLKRAAQGIYGYSIRSERYVESIINWFSRRHQWKLEPNWLTDTPGVVTALSLAVELFSEPGGKVILQSPVYYPFYDVIRLNGREVAKNALVKENGRYRMDYVQLEQLMQEGAKLLLLCNPHNPAGRVWERDELAQLAELAKRYDVKIVSDEIHCDIIMPGHRHVPFASISEDAASRTITTLAPTKTFNIPGLHSSFVAIANPEIKRRFDYRLKALSLHMTNFFTMDAVTAAYNEGEDWLDEMIVYIKDNLDAAVSHLAEHLPEVTPMIPESTILLWLDCSALGLDASGLKRLMFEEAKVAFSDGSVFGEEGSGYLRINLACPRSVLLEALGRFTRAARRHLAD